MGYQRSRSFPGFARAVAEMNEADRWAWIETVVLIETIQRQAERMNINENNRVGGRVKSLQPSAD